MNPGDVVGPILAALPSLHRFHSPGTAAYAALKAAARADIEAMFSSTAPEAAPLGPFGAITLPYYKMGAVDSLDLFGLDELILFAFYWTNRARYRRALDIGANLGLHSVILSRCGLEVRAFEPDPIHFSLLRSNLEHNGCPGVTAFQAAISDHAGQMEFVRVKGNLTGSHLAGSKPDPYGDLERFDVPLESIRDHLEWADLVKMDAEGHERQILLATSPDQWRTREAVVEVTGADNARAIFEHFQGTGISLRAQRLGWDPVEDPSDMPTSHRDGSLLITGRPGPFWSA